MKPDWMIVAAIEKKTKRPALNWREYTLSEPKPTKMDPYKQRVDE